MLTLNTLQMGFNVCALTPFWETAILTLVNEKKSRGLTIYAALLCVPGMRSRKSWPWRTSGTEINCLGSFFAQSDNLYRHLERSAAESRDLGGKGHQTSEISPLTPLGRNDGMGEPGRSDGSMGSTGISDRIRRW